MWFLGWRDIMKPQLGSTKERYQTIVEMKYIRHSNYVITKTWKNTYR